MSDSREYRKAGSSTKPTQLARLSKSDNSSVRAQVANNPYTHPDTLRALVHGRYELYVEVAKNPATPMDVLVYMIEYPKVFKLRNEPKWRSTSAGWKEIALRHHLTQEVYDAFSQISIESAADLAANIRGRCTNGTNRHNPQVEGISPRLLFMLASMKDTRKLVLPNRSERWPSIGELLAGYHFLDERTMVVLAQNGDQPTQAELINAQGKSLPRSVALALAESDHTTILDWLRKGSVLTESEKSRVSERLEARPDWMALEAERADAEDKLRIAQEAEHAEKLKRQKIVDASGKVIQEAALDSDVFDSPVEEVFWEAYRKSLPSSLDGLVAQHVLGRFRLDFAIPKKKIGIEIDGFRYHASQEAIMKDRQRQRAVEQQGWRIVRFAAKEVFNDPKGCVKQAADWVQDL